MTPTVGLLIDNKATARGTALLHSFSSLEDCSLFAHVTLCSAFCLVNVKKMLKLGQ